MRLETVQCQYNEGINIFKLFLLQALHFYTVNYWPVVDNSAVACFHGFRNRYRVVKMMKEEQINIETA